MMFHLLALGLLVGCSGTPDAPVVAAVDVTAFPDDLEDYAESSTIRGLIVDEDGWPIAGASAQPGVYTVTKAIPSDAQGRFATGVGFGYEPGTEIHLLVSAPGFVTARESIDLGVQDARIVLSRGASIAGRFELPEGESLRDGAEVVIRSNGGQHRVPVADGGAFASTGFEPREDLWIEVRVDGWVPHWFETLPATKGEIVDLGALTLDRGGSIDVTAVDTYGERVFGSGTYLRTEGPPNLWWHAPMDEDGVARFRGIPVGVPMVLQVGSPDGFGRSLRIEHDVRTLTLESTERESIEALLKRPVLIRGTFEWTGTGSAPWDDEERLFFEASARRDGELEWERIGVVPDLGTKIGERESTDFHLWAIPGEWTIDLRTRAIETRGARYRARFDVDVPRAPKGMLSGEVDVGVVRIGP